MQPLAKRTRALAVQNAAEAHGKPAHDGEIRRSYLERINILACHSVSSGRGLIPSATAITAPKPRNP